MLASGNTASENKQSDEAAPSAQPCSGAGVCVQYLGNLSVRHTHAFICCSLIFPPHLKPSDHALISSVLPFLETRCTSCSKLNNVYREITTGSSLKPGRAKELTSSYICAQNSVTFPGRNKNWTLVWTPLL